MAQFALKAQAALHSEEKHEGLGQKKKKKTILSLNYDFHIVCNTAINPSNTHIDASE